MAEIDEVEVSRDLISRVTDKVVEEMEAWMARPPDGIYPVVLIDALYVKIREGHVTDRPIYVAAGIHCHGERGVQDVRIACCDGLKRRPEAIEEIWPRPTMQPCVVHLVRSSLRYASRPHWSASPGPAADLHRPGPGRRRAAVRRFRSRAGEKYPAVIRLWRDGWPTFTPFPAFPAGTRKIVCTTNAIESLNARFRQTTRRCAHFPRRAGRPQGPLPGIRQPLKGRPNVTGNTSGRKAALNTLSLHHGDRITLN
ncbi:transposase [Actinomadura sp. NAK00032]|nr:transposase [Actinomadura sp. NAK00032]